MAMKEWLGKYLIGAETAALLDAQPKQLGSRGFDPWGFNYEHAKAALGLVRPLYEKYFRVEAYGLENLPRDGRLLVIPNHAGQVPMDGVLVGYAMSTNPHGPRIPRTMIERFFPTIPWLGNLMNSAGAVIGDPINCIKMLRRDEAIIVFPEGVRGSGKPFRKRYQLQRFGNGFMHLAMETGTPIVPVGVVGCEESMPSLGSLDPIAKLLGIPYLPIALPVLMPTKVILHFGKPMHFDNQVQTEQQVTERVREVKAEIRKLIEQGLEKRKSVFDGLLPSGAR